MVENQRSREETEILQEEPSSEKIFLKELEVEFSPCVGCEEDCKTCRC